MKKLVFLSIFISFLFTGCHAPCMDLEPTVHEPAHPKQQFRETRRVAYPCPADFSSSPFTPLSQQEMQEEWGKEYRIGLCFAADFDLYRAITSFKRALVLVPEDAQTRIMEIRYALTLSYYLGKKYREALYQVECSELVSVDPSFPAFSDFLLILYECYQKVGNEVQACHILNLIEAEDPEKADKLRLLADVQRVDLAALYQEGKKNPSRAYLENIVCNYQSEALSIKKAQFLNATLPGAGYWYVGQKETAVTAMLINGLFIAATVHFFNQSNIGAGILTLSLESGWYIGGIWGAGLAAKTYNERLYACYADKISVKENYFPLMMLRYTF